MSGLKPLISGFCKMTKPESEYDSHPNSHSETSKSPLFLLNKLCHK